MTEEERNLQELERLKKTYYLFEFDLQDTNLKVQTSKSSWSHFSLNNGHLPWESRVRLDEEHMRKSISKDLMELYPNLWISAYSNHKELVLGVWVKRGNLDAEAIGEISITHPELHTKLKIWEEQAKLAKQEGWFFCSGHGLAEQKKEGFYFYFAGNYCKEWGDTNPEQRRRALVENYD